DVGVACIALFFSDGYDFEIERKRGIEWVVEAAAGKARVEAQAAGFSGARCAHAPRLTRFRVGDRAGVEGRARKQGPIQIVHVDTERAGTLRYELPAQTRGQNAMVAALETDDVVPADDVRAAQGSEPRSAGSPDRYTQDRA